MKISSRAFQDQSVIPSQYTCDGQDRIPPLSFADVPTGAKTLALVMDDPDAPMGIWDHWVIWNISPTTKEIPEGQAPQGIAGRNSWGKNSYGGPCPPDREHRYFFKLYALDTTLDLPPSSRKSDLEKAMKGHILTEAQLMGRYDRKRGRG